MSKSYKLGDEVIDEITGIQGIAVGRCEYLYGCVQVGIARKVDKEGKIPETIYFDEPRIKLVKSKSIPRNPTTAEAGGPDTAPKMGGRR